MDGDSGHSFRSRAHNQAAEHGRSGSMGLEMILPDFVTYY